MTDAAAHTHYLHAAYKAGNGRRMTKDFPLTTNRPRTRTLARRRFRTPVPTASVATGTS